MRIRFLSDQIYETGGRGIGPRFSKGQVLGESEVVKAIGLKSEPSPDWVAGFLNRWIQRGVAVDHDASPEETVEQPVADLAALTRAELDALAAARGVDITEAKNKADVIAALELAAEQPAA